MTIIFPQKFHFLALMLLLLCACNYPAPSDRIYQQRSPYNYDDTVLNLDIAISEHNYRIIHRSQIGQAIRQRGEKAYPLSVVVNFCNITYAKEMLDINPALINDMPCTITVRQDKGDVIVGTRLMNEQSPNARQNAFAKRINDDLRAIIAATIE